MQAFSQHTLASIIGIGLVTTFIACADPNEIVSHEHTIEAKTQQDTDGERTYYDLEVEYNKERSEISDMLENIQASAAEFSEKTHEKTQQAIHNFQSRLEQNDTAFDRIQNSADRSWDNVKEDWHSVKQDMDSLWKDVKNEFDGDREVDVEVTIEDEHNH